MITPPPLVSVVIPNYNHQRFLNERIDSILNQTFQDFELILLDDFSTDESKTIILSYENNPKISHIVLNDKNSGSTFKQWNKGVQLAQGEYIWLAESDDSSSPLFLEKLITEIQTHKNCGIAYCQSNGYDEKSNILGDCLEWTNDLNQTLWKTNFFLSGEEMVSKYLIIKNVIPNASATIFKKEVFLEAKGGPEDMKYCGDWLLWSRMLTKTNICYVSDTLNNFRFHAQTTRNNESIQKVLSKINEDLTVIDSITSSIVIERKVIKKALNKIVYEWIKYIVKEKKYNSFLKIKPLFKTRGISLNRVVLSLIYSSISK